MPHYGFPGVFDARYETNQTPLLQLISFAVRTTAGKVRTGKPPFLQCLANLIPQKGGELKGEVWNSPKKKVSDNKPGLFLNRH